MSRLAQPAYRVRQFAWAAATWLRGDGGAEALAARTLPPRAVELFRRLPRYDRRHAARVAQALHAQGDADPDLLAAALLHDAGKAAAPDGRLRLWHRVAVVLLQALWPGLLDRLAQGGGWRRPFWVQQHHAAIGAGLAEQAGCSPAAADLIRRHEGPPGAGDGRLLAALKAADGRN